MRKRILLVDDHPLVRQGIAQLINGEHDVEVCGEAEDAGQAVKQIQALTPDLVIVDITLKSTSGIELIKQIKELHKNIKILVYSMHEELLYGERALRAGAKGYVHKQDDPDTILKAIRQVILGKIFISEELNTKLLEKSLTNNHKNHDSPTDMLSDREFEVFRLIGNGLKPKQIAVELNISPRTVENYRTNIREKLFVDSAAELSKIAIDWNKNGGR